MKLVLEFLILFQCHQQSAQFNIAPVLFILKYNFEKLLASLEFFFNASGTKTIAKM